MVPPFLYDLSRLDLNKIIIPVEEIRKSNPQRFEMEQLSGIVHIDMEAVTVIGVKEITEHEFWVRGHIPGRPLMPGVMMIEAAAQLCSYMGHLKLPDMGFLGFAKCDETRFRSAVVPPGKFYVIAQLTSLSRRRVVANCQGIFNGTLVFETIITGMSV